MRIPAFSRRAVAAACVGVVASIGLSLPAQAANVAPVSPAAQVSSDSGETVIYGGTTQSTDPSRYDYVPPVATGIGGKISPMSATGAQAISPFSFVWNGVTVAVPTGLLYHSINGSGLQIASEGAQYVPSGGLAFKICNYQYQFQNRYGSTIYSTRSTALQTGCAYGPAALMTVGNFSVHTGAQCARLYVNGDFRGEQCHSVS